MKRLLLCILACLILSGCRSTDSQPVAPLRSEGEYLHESILRAAETAGKRLGATDPMFKALLELADYAYKHKERCKEIAERWQLLERRMHDELSGN